MEQFWTNATQGREPPPVMQPTGTAACPFAEQPLPTGSNIQVINYGPAAAAFLKATIGTSIRPPKEQTTTNNFFRELMGEGQPLRTDDPMLSEYRERWARVLRPNRLSDGTKYEEHDYMRSTDMLANTRAWEVNLRLENGEEVDLVDVIGRYVRDSVIMAGAFGVVEERDLDDGIKDQTHRLLKHGVCNVTRKKWEDMKLLTGKALDFLGGDTTEDEAIAAHETIVSITREIVGEIWAQSPQDGPRMDVDLMTDLALSLTYSDNPRLSTLTEEGIIQATANLYTGWTTSLTSLKGALFSLLCQEDRAAINCGLDDPELWPRIVNQAVVDGGHFGITNPRIVTEEKIELGDGVALYEGQVAVSSIYAMLSGHTLATTREELLACKQLETIPYGPGPHMCPFADYAKKLMAYFTRALFTINPTLQIKGNLQDVEIDTSSPPYPPIAMPVTA